MKVVERVLEKMLCGIVSVDEMQLSFMPERGAIDAVFILRRMQEEDHVKGEKLHMCFVDLEEAFDRVPRKVLEWAMRKKGIPEVLVRSVMGLYEGAKTRVRVDSELSEEFEVIVGMPQGFVLSCFPFALVVGVVTEFAIEGALSELLYADDLVLMSQTIEVLRNKFLKWKVPLENKGLKVNGKTKIMVRGGVTKDSMYDPCGVCSLNIKANSVLLKNVSAITARTRYWWVRFRECCELLYGIRYNNNGNF